MQRLEKLDTSTIKQEIGNILNKNLAIGRKNSIAFNFSQIKISELISEINLKIILFNQSTRSIIRSSVHRVSCILSKLIIIASASHINSIIII